MIRVAVCDDDLACRNQILTFLCASSFGEVLQIVPYGSGDQLLLDYQKGQIFDMIFLDVEMPGTDGINTAQQIRKSDPDVVLIFVSSHSSYVFSVFDLRASSYLVKPIKEEELQRELEVGISHYHERSTTYIVSNHTNSVAVKIKTIQYLEARGHLIQLYTENGVLSCKSSIQEEAKKLAPHGFIQSHRSFLVNPYYIREIDRMNIRMKNNDIVPISQKNKKKVMNQFHRFLARYGI